MDVSGFGFNYQLGLPWDHICLWVDWVWKNLHDGRGRV